MVVREMMTDQNTLLSQNYSASGHTMELNVVICLLVDIAKSRPLDSRYSYPTLLVAINREGFKK